MKQAIAILSTIVLFSTCPLYADYTVEDRGAWPDDWPKELEPLRAQSRTLQGPLRPSLHYAIPFTKRGDFESAWPHLLKVKTKGAPIVLRRRPSFWLGHVKNAGVCVHTPPEGQVPIADGKDAKGNWENAIYIELIVDGEFVDLNRILLPPDTPIIDERFKAGLDVADDEKAQTPVAWGEAAGALQAGLALHPVEKRSYHVGGNARFVVTVRNVSDRPAEMLYELGNHPRVGPSILDSEGKRPQTAGPVHIGVGGRAIGKLELAPGQEVEIATPELIFDSIGESRVQEQSAVLGGPGMYRVRYNVYYLNADKDNTANFLLTGPVQVEVIRSKEQEQP